jgi:hypothetical protein
MNEQEKLENLNHGSSGINVWNTANIPKKQRYLKDTLDTISLPINTWIIKELIQKSERWEIAIKDLEKETWKCINDIKKIKESRMNGDPHLWQRVAWSLLMEKNIFKTLGETNSWKILLTKTSTEVGRIHMGRECDYALNLWRICEQRLYTEARRTFRLWKEIKEETETMDKMRFWTWNETNTSAVENLLHQIQSYPTGKNTISVIFLKTKMNPTLKAVLFEKGVFKRIEEDEKPWEKGIQIESLDLKELLAERTEINTHIERLAVVEINTRTMDYNSTEDILLSLLI